MHESCHRTIVLIYKRSLTNENFMFDMAHRAQQKSARGGYRAGNVLFLDLFYD